MDHIIFKHILMNLANVMQQAVQKYNRMQLFIITLHFWIKKTPYYFVNVGLSVVILIAFYNL